MTMGVAGYGEALQRAVDPRGSAAPLRAGRRRAAESGVSRATLAKWYGRWVELGEGGLVDQSSRPRTSPAAIGDDIMDAILELRRTEKWGNARIAAHL